MDKSVDQAIDEIVAKFGIPHTLAALARYCQRYPNKVLALKIRDIYDWLKDSNAKTDSP
jgi:hypothetical protein